MSVVKKIFLCLILHLANFVKLKTFVKIFAMIRGEIWLCLKLYFGVRFERQLQIEKGLQ